MLMFVGAFCSVIIGEPLPFLSFIAGNNTNSFRNSDEMVSKILNVFIQYLITGVFAIFAGWGMQYFWMAAG